MVSDQLLRKQIRRVIGLDIYRATLGGEDGRVDAPGLPGYVVIRYIQAGGAFSQPVTVRFRAVMKKTPGAAIIVGYDDDGELAVLRSDFVGETSVGTMPQGDNPADDNVSYFIQQQRLVTFVCHPVSSAADSMLVTVQSGTVIDLANKTFSYFFGSQEDLTTYIPAGAGEWCLACLFLKPDYTIEIFASTSKTSPDDLGFDDINECFAATTTGSLPIWAWRLYNGQTGIASGAPADGGDDYMDLRPLFFMLSAGSGVVETIVAGDGIAVDDTDPANPIVSLADHIEVAEYIDLEEWGSPTSPAANITRIFSEDFNGFTVTKMRLADDTEIIIGSGRYFIARNPGSTITAGELVRYTGSSHAATTLPFVARADADSPSTMPVDGIAIDTAAFNAALRVVTEGYAIVDTTGFSDGNAIFASGTAGGWVTSAPAFPSVSQRVGIVVLGGSATGLVYIFPQPTDGLQTRVLNTTLAIGGTAPGANVDFWSNIGSQRGRLTWTPTGSPRTLTLPDTTATLTPFTTHAVAPTVNDDSGDAYVVGHRWLDTTADVEYVCIDNTLGAAVWLATTGGMFITEIELDFGSTPVRSAAFSISDANVTTAKKITMQHSLAAATGRSLDENEMDTFLCRCTCTSNGTVRAYIDSLFGPVTGKYKFNYTYS